MTETQVCGNCWIPLPINCFGICRARRSGRNLYCHACMRKKVYASRDVAKEMKRRKEQIKEREMVAQ